MACQHSLLAASPQAPQTEGVALAAPSCGLTSCCGRAHSAQPQLPQHLSLCPLLVHAPSCAQTYCCRPDRSAQWQHLAAQLWPAEAPAGLRPLPFCSAASSSWLPASPRAADQTAQRLAALGVLGRPAHLLQSKPCPSRASAAAPAMLWNSSQAICRHAAGASTLAQHFASLSFHVPSTEVYLSRASSSRCSSRFSMGSAHHTCGRRPFRHTCTRLPPILRLRA